MKFSGEPISYKARNGYCEGLFEREPENIFVTSKEELQSCLSQYGTVYVGGEEGFTVVEWGGTKINEER